jgi:hypothetical protein
MHKRPTPQPKRTGMADWPKVKKVRHRGLTAHARARYRCFLPDLAGLAGVRRVRPIPDLLHSSIHNRPGTKTAIMKHRGKYQNFDRSRTLDSAPTHCHPERSMNSQFFLRDHAQSRDLVFLQGTNQLPDPANADSFVRSAIIGRCIVFVLLKIFLRKTLPYPLP